MKRILEDEGISLVSDNGIYYLIYDGGELMIKMKKLEITHKEAEEVINNPDIMYRIIIQYQDKGIFGENLNL